MYAAGKNKEDVERVEFVSISEMRKRVEVAKREEKMEMNKYFLEGKEIKDGERERV
jgi:hypothetical protein